jgi:uncharacterized membrane protein YkvA (DUF1232 family)
MPPSESSSGNALTHSDDNVLASEAPDPLPVLADAASRVLQRRFRVVLLIRNAYERMLAHSDILSAVWRDLKTMLRLLIRWVDRSYRRVSWTPLLLIVGALLYFVVPVDTVPDALGAIGFVDDVTVISTVVEQVRHELDRFRHWEDTTPLPE